MLAVPRAERVPRARRNPQQRLSGVDVMSNAPLGGGMKR